MATRPRVLVIEDDPTLREILCAVLEDEGYRALASDHPVEPVNVQQVRPSLVVLDLMLRGEPAGIGCLQNLRARQWTADLPVIVCSGALQGNSPLMSQVESLANATIPKPFDINDFLSTVARCLPQIS